MSTSAIGYGAKGISAYYGPGDEQEGIVAIHRPHDLGVTLFETRELYGRGENKKIVGPALAGIRDNILIATKFGFTRDLGTDGRVDDIREVVDGGAPAEVA